MEGHGEASDLVSSPRFDSLVDLSLLQLWEDGDDDDNDAESTGFYEASLFKNRVSLEFCFYPFFNLVFFPLYYQLFAFF